MKKFFLTFAALCAMSAQAQLFVGGTGRFGYADNTFVLSALPEAGYEFNEYWAVGGSLGFSMAAHDGVYTYGVVEPFVRFTPWHNERIALDIKGGAEFTFSDYLAGCELGFRPSMRFFVNDHFDVFADLGLIGVSYDGEDWSPAFLVTGCNVHLGVSYKF